MEEGNRKYPVAYRPIPKGIIKEEPEDQEEFGEQSEQLLAYPPIPHGVIKEEPQLEDGIQDETVVLGYIKEEPTFEEEDGDECSLVAYAPLPHGDIKEELEVEDGHDESCSGVQETPQQGGKENLTIEATGGASVIVPLVDSAGNEIGIDSEPRANKRQRTMQGQQSPEPMPSSIRILRSRSRGSSTLKNTDDGVNQAKELTMVCDTGAKQQQVRSNIHQPSEHSSLENASSPDEEDLVPNRSFAGPSKRKKKSTRKLPGEANHSQEKEKLPCKCKTCGLAFKGERYLRQHLARSCGIKPQFPCKECGSLFTRKPNLQQHLMNIHNVEKSQLATFGAGPIIRPTLPFKCDKCSRTYKQKRNLTRHLKYECKVDPSFTCTLCDYRAKQKSVLRDHLMMVHNVSRSQFTTLGDAAPKTRPVQPFKCEKCGRSYKQKYDLTRHLKYECGVDPSFLCTQCDYRASQKTTLKQHLNDVHAGAARSQEIVTRNK